LLPALSALNRNLDALTNPRRLRGGNCSQSLVLCLLAGLAALRLVSQTFVMEKNLFSGCPDKVFSTIHAFDRAILMFSFGLN